MFYYKKLFYTLSIFKIIAEIGNRFNYYVNNSPFYDVLSFQSMKIYMVSSVADL